MLGPPDTHVLAPHTCVFYGETSPEEDPQLFVKGCKTLANAYKVPFTPLCSILLSPLPPHTKPSFSWIFLSPTLPPLSSLPFILALIP
jgi:hypothetical protein